MKLPSVFFLALLAAGCASYADRQHAQELSDNRQDDEYCVAHGLHYPDPAYVTCRWNLENQRLYRQWKSTQMMRTPPGPPAAPGVAVPFRDLDRQSYSCHPEPQFGQDYVFCSEGAAARP
ncbi:MAG: hypothetical protein ACM3ZT_03115 [Bacillota bacterium]